jgi:4-hydroxybenzoate polyprenyltransferase
LAKLLNRKQRILFIKFLAALSLVRWYNLLIVLLAQYLTALFVFNPGVNKKDVLYNIDLHFMVLATGFIVAAGFIINSFYDLEKDLVANPRKTVFNRVISSTTAFRAYFMFNAIGLTFSFFTSHRVFIYFLFFSIALWYYSHKLQKKAIIREVSASLLIVGSVLSIGLYYQHLTWPIAVYSLLIICQVFNLQLSKEMQSYQADSVVGNHTIPVHFSFEFAHRLHLLAFYGIATLAVLMLLQTNSLPLKLFLGILSLTMLYSGYISSQNKRDQYIKSNLFVKVCLFFSILFIVFV